MKRSLHTLIVLLVSALMLTSFGGQTAYTQTPLLPAPIILTMGNARDVQAGKGTDIWQLSTLNGPFKQRSTWNYNTDPAVVSPDGQWFAYRSVAQVAVTATREGRFPRGVGEQIPYTIWIVSMDDTVEKRVGEQPANAVLADVTGRPDYFITRSNPVWSPSGDRLAWIESTVSGSLTIDTETRLVVYDLNRGRQTILSRQIALGAGYEGMIYPQLIWGDFFIAVDQRQFQGGGGAGVEFAQIHFFSPENGALIASTPQLQDVGDFTWLRAPFIRNSTRQLLFIPSVSQAFDPQSGQEVTLSGLPELYSPNFPDGYSWRMDVNKNWVEVAPNGATRSIPGLSGMNGFSMAAFGVSPDGQGLVYLRLDKVNILYAGRPYTLTPNGTPYSVSWGPLEWRESRVR